MHQEIKGSFTLGLWGMPLLFFGKLYLESEQKNHVIGYGLFVGPIGIVVPKSFRFKGQK